MLIQIDINFQHNNYKKKSLQAVILFCIIYFNFNKCYLLLDLAFILIKFEYYINICKEQPIYLQHNI